MANGFQDAHDADRRLFRGVDGVRPRLGDVGRTGKIEDLVRLRALHESRDCHFAAHVTLHEIEAIGAIVEVFEARRWRPSHRANYAIAFAGK